MSLEIERKFAVKELPNLDNLKPIRYERYYLPSTEGNERRVQKKDDKYELEELQEQSSLVRNKIKTPISEADFNRLKAESKDCLIRDSYLIQNDPEISIKIYHGRFVGLIRAEVEFKSEEDSKSFVPPKWFGKEITSTALGRDSKLLNLNQTEYNKLIEEHCQS